jgi:hypothetical protein
MLQPPLDEAQEVNTAATAMKSATITMIFLIFVVFKIKRTLIAWLKKRNWDQVIQRKGCGLEAGLDHRSNGRRPDISGFKDEGSLFRKTRGRNVKLFVRIEKECVTIRS